MSLRQLHSDLWISDSPLRFFGLEIGTRMTVVRLSGGRLAIYSAIALEEGEMAKLEALGKPSYLIVPSAIHRLDVKGYCERYPELVVLAPRGSRGKVGEVVPVDASYGNLEDPRVELVTVAGTDESEFAMIVRTETGRTLVVNDLIFNLPRVPGLAGLGLRLLGFSPGAPSMPKLVMKRLVHDRSAVRAQSNGAACAGSTGTRGATNSNWSR